MTQPVFIRLILGAALMLPQVAAAQTPEQHDTAIQRIVGDPEDMTQPGCAAGVFSHGEPVWMGAGGAADLATGEALTIDSRFYAGSLSKQFTALGIMKLVEAGKVDLDAEVQTYIPDFPHYDAPVTVRMLLHHISGMRDALGLMRMAGVPDLSKSDLRTALQLLHRQKAPDFTPGTHYSYSNGGYLLLADIIQRASDMPYQDYMRETVLDPLGMTRSFFLAAPPPPGTMVHGYKAKNGKYVVQDDFPSFSGSGGLVTSIRDLARYEADLAGGNIVWIAQTRQLMLAPAYFTNGDIVREQHGLVYASGIKLGKRQGRDWMMHTGASSTFKSAYGRLPEEGLAIMLMCNRSDGAPSDRMDAIADLLAGPPPAPTTTESDKKGSENNAIPFQAGLPEDGRYHSDELNVDYLLHRRGEGVDVQILSAWPGHEDPAAIHHFLPDEHGILREGSMSIVPAENGAGFVAGRGKIHGIRFLPKD
ncbi:class A beta-lactamase-related serine hydrolase [Altericroceibacterium spongiae]|uniref:Class A beta-lactamase-related serine hydrolase n=1 Tax=Altericroceibacterium spongiae TaxID=2320269 RepID=A0A420EE58_9SPHN|nr:serine hydrolase domain-containing protein [Altericroceibacterium spongiae]RKF18944.1 class A beta-lactamase-related serine hydrolase [Altericroceibacterium spongiae]